MGKGRWRRIEKMINEREIEFLKESNAIEREYSDEALIDAKHAWSFAKRHKHMINLDYIELIHNELLRRLNSQIAGNFRTVQVGVQTKNGFKEAVHCSQIKYLLRELIDKEIEDEEDVKQWHIAFEKIHPFEDGNGRVGRILMNIQRLNIKLPLLIIHTGKEQQEYYKWFDEKKGSEKMKYKTKYLKLLKRQFKSLETEISRHKRKIKRLKYTKEKVGKEIIKEGGKIRK